MKTVPLSQIFKINNGVPSGQITMVDEDLDNKNIVRYIRPSKTMNGTFSGWVDKTTVNPQKVFGKEMIFVSTNGEGSHTYTYISPFEFIPNSDVSVLEELPTNSRKLSLNEKIFYAQCITYNRYKFNYGRKPKENKLKDLLLPDIDDIPIYVNRVSLPDLSDCKKQLEPKNKTPDLNTNKWRIFKISDIFGKPVKCKCNVANDLIDGNDIWYIGASSQNNGAIKKVSYNKGLVTKGNCIVFIGDGQGSVGFANYAEDDFIGSATLSVGYNKNLNKYNAMFLVSIFKIERYRYSFGRKWNGKRLEESTFKLPSIDTQGTDKNGNIIYEPDWQFMEKYIKTLHYSASL